MSRSRVSCRPDPELEGVLVAKPTGHLDASQASRSWEAVSLHLGEERPMLLVDLSEVASITSAGVGLLIRLLNHVRPLGGALCVYGCSERVREVFRISLLDDVLDIADTAEEARERLRPEGRILR